LNTGLTEAWRDDIEIDTVFIVLQPTPHEDLALRAALEGQEDQRSMRAMIVPGSGSAGTTEEEGLCISQGPGFEALAVDSTVSGNENPDHNCTAKRCASNIQPQLEARQGF